MDEIAFRHVEPPQDFIDTDEESEDSEIPAETAADVPASAAKLSNSAAGLFYVKPAWL